MQVFVSLTMACVSSALLQPSVHSFSHAGMDNLIDCRGIGLTLADEIGDTGFHDFALIVYHIMAYQSA